MEGRDLNPTVEEYHSDDSGIVLRRPSPTANVAAKRSHPSDLGTEKPGLVNPIDVQSDSGYSSHTATTMGSADSAPSKPPQSLPTPPASEAPIPPPSPATSSSRRRPTLTTEDRKTSSQNSPRKPLQRTGSVASKRPPANRRQQPEEVEECRDPNCTKCEPATRAPRRKRLSQLGSTFDVSSYTSLDQRSQRSDPAPPTYTSPPSPEYSRQPAPYAQGPAVVQPAQTRRRASSTTRRPISYHEGAGEQYFANALMSGQYSSPPEQHGPPLSASAHFGMHHHPQMGAFPMGATPPNYYSLHQHMAQTSPPFEQPRPAISARTSSNYQPRRPQSGYGPALVTYDRSDRGDQPMPSARYHNGPKSARRERPPPSQLDPESSEYDSSSSEDYEEEDRRTLRDRALMPPPPKTKSVPKERRPSLRHANTTQVYNERRVPLSMSQSMTLPERVKERDSRASRVSTAAPSRAPSVSRPALIQHPKAQSAYETPRPAKVMVEKTNSRRRQSLQPYQKEYPAEQEYEVIQQKRRNRDSKIYREDYEDAIIVPEQPRPRRRTDATTIGRRDEYITEPKQRRTTLDRTTLDAEAYQRSTRGTIDPHADSVHKAAKRASRVPSGPSDAGSSRSDDRKTRVSQSARTTITNGGGNGDIRLRVDASAPLSLQFNGDMEGRILQINPVEGGMADIVIGGSRDNESVYRSEKGSIAGNRRSLIAGGARRDLEDMSVKSSRSGHSRREMERRELEMREPERERRVLRRRTEYN